MSELTEWRLVLFASAEIKILIHNPNANAANLHRKSGRQKCLMDENSPAARMNREADLILES